MTFSNISSKRGTRRILELAPTFWIAEKLTFVAQRTNSLYAVFRNALKSPESVAGMQLAYRASMPHIKHESARSHKDEAHSLEQCLKDLQAEYDLTGASIDVVLRQGGPSDRPNGYCERDGVVWTIVVDRPCDWLLRHEFLHIVLEERGCQIDATDNQHNFERYASDLKRLVDEFLIETEMQRRVPDSSYLFEQYRVVDNVAFVSLIWGGASIPTASALLELLGLQAIATHIYHELGNHKEAAFTRDIIKSYRFTKVLNVLNGCDFRRTDSNKYRDIVSRVHESLTESALLWVSEGIAAFDTKATSRFLKDVEHIKGSLSIYRTTLSKTR